MASDPHGLRLHREGFGIRVHFRSQQRITLKSVIIPSICEIKHQKERETVRDIQLLLISVVWVFITGCNKHWNRIVKRSKVGVRNFLVSTTSEKPTSVNWLVGGMIVSLLICGNINMSSGITIEVAASIIFWWTCHHVAFHRATFQIPRKDRHFRHVTWQYDTKAPLNHWHPNMSPHPYAFNFLRSSVSLADGNRLTVIS